MKIVSIEVKKDQLTTQTVAIGKSVLKVNSRPWADVFVDGQSVGKTPVQRPVYEGRHEVKLVNPESGERIQISTDACLAITKRLIACAGVELGIGH